MVDFLLQLLDDKVFVGGAVAVIIFGLTQLLKLPIKALTNKIKNERARRMTNIVIYFIPFALGVLAEYLYVTFYLSTDFLVDWQGNLITGLSYGTGSLSLYALIERFFNVKVSNPYTETEDGKAVAELVDNVVADGKVDSTDKDAIEEFWEKVQK